MLRGGERMSNAKLKLISTVNNKMDLNKELIKLKEENPKIFSSDFSTISMLEDARKKKQEIFIIKIKTGNKISRLPTFNFV